METQLRSRKTSLVINLGEYIRGNTDRHSAFIVFFVNEGFLEAFHSIGKVKFKINRKTEECKKIQEDVRSYSSKLKKCFPPRFLPVSQLFPQGDEQKELLPYVEDIIKSIESAIGFAAYGGTVAKERTLQKIRPIIQELIQNISDHAYGEKNLNYRYGSDYFAIFVRAIFPKEDKNQERKDRDTKNIPVIEDLARESGFPRIELYILDGGISLRTYADRMAGKELKQVVASLGSMLLKGDSEAYREKEGKSGIAGLRHIGNILMHERDYIRLFTADGMVGLCSEEHDKRRSRQPRYITFGLTRSQGIAEQIFKVMGLTNDTPPKGTCYCISMPIYRESIKFPEPWYTPSSEEKDKLFGKIKLRNQGTTLPQTTNKSVFFDSFFKEVDIDYPGTEEIKKFGLLEKRSDSEILIVRLPRRVSKDICIRWLNVVTDKNFSFRSVIFADVSPSFAQQLLEIVKSKKIFSGRHPNIRILTTAWNTASLSFDSQERSFCLNVPGFTARDFYSGDEPKAFEFMQHLIEQDSKIFWKDINEAFFYNGRVKVESQEIVKGYLHFKEAIADKNRRAVCKLALKRILHLLLVKEIRTFEPLARSLTQELALELRNVIQEDGKIIAVASVNATTDSFEQYEAKHFITPDILVACFQAPLEGKRQPFIAVPVLDWTPNKNMHTQEILKKRIEKTPYILPEGKDSIELPHHVPGSEFKKSTYGCLKEETYNQFSQLDCLRFQHTKNGTKHDLLSVNTVRAVESSIHNIFGPYSWLKREFSKKKNFVVVYPSHYANDITLGYFLEESISRISVSFFSDKGSIPLRLSPSSAENIKKYCDPKENSKVIIFDDGVITGNHISFLKDYIQHMCSIPQNSIYTISLVDRTRTPVDFKVVEEKSKQNLRYWRHDVPVFAEEHSCIFCHAIQRLKDLLDHLPFTVKEEISSKWIPTWEVKDIYSEWGASGLSPISMKQGHEVVFGKENANENNIFIKNSTALLAYITEITQLIPHKLNGIKMGKDFLEKFPKITIELVAGQFFLSYYELDSKVKKESLEMLFDAIKNIIKNANSVDLDKYVALVAMCFLAVEKNIFQSVWNEVIVDFIKNSEKKWDITTTSFLSILYYYCNAKPETVIDTKTNYQNLIAAGILPSLILVIQPILVLIGVRAGEHHKTELTQNITVLEKILSGDVKDICLAHIRRIYDDLSSYSSKCQAPNLCTMLNESFSLFFPCLSEIKVSPESCL